MDIIATGFVVVVLSCLSRILTYNIMNCRFFALFCGCKAPLDEEHVDW